MGDFIKKNILTMISTIKSVRDISEAKDLLIIRVAYTVVTLIYSYIFIKM